tara:strand:+ start:2967 stop:3215 length:249 start_codon:yes stop_codon:yes gene_type:complete
MFDYCPQEKKVCPFCYDGTITHGAFICGVTKGGNRIGVNLHHCPADKMRHDHYKRKFGVASMHWDRYKERYQIEEYAKEKKK